MKVCSRWWIGNEGMVKGSLGNEGMIKRDNVESSYVQEVAGNEGKIKRFDGE